MPCSLRLALGGLTLASLAGCLAGDGGRPLGEPCSGNGDCRSGLWCTYGRCRQRCSFDRECGVGAACVPSTGDPTLYVCTLVGEGGREECPDGLGADQAGTCRRICDADSSAPDAPCGPAQFCEQGWCVAREEMDGGMPGADSGAVGEGGPDASADGLVCSQGGSSGSFAGAIQITIDGTKVAGDVHEFPLLVSIDDNPDLAREAQVDGLDIIFEEAQGEPLSHELEEYNNGTGALVAWVMVPLLRGGQDETLCLRYGHESLRQPSERPSVWSVDYRLVLHMADVSLLEDGSHLIVDSSTCGNDFVGHGPGLDVSTRALFGQGLGLNSGFLQRQDILGPLSSITLSAWVNLQPLVPGQKGAEVINLGNSVGLRMDDIDQDGVVMFRFTEGAEYDVAASGDFIAGAGWRYVVGTYDVTQGIQRVYLDGAPAAELAVSSPTGGATDQVTRIGMHVQDYQIWYAWQGTIDEVRVADVARSAERIATEYNNYSSPSTFYSLIHIPGSP